MNKISKEIEQAILPILEEHAVVLFEVKYSSYEGKGKLKIVIDEESGGITLDKCALIAKQIGFSLDHADIIYSKYMLEVTSPGFDWPGMGDKELKRLLNKEIVLYYSVENKTMDETGILVSYGEKDIVLRTDSGDKTFFRPSLKKIKQVLRFRKNKQEC